MGFYYVNIFQTELRNETTQGNDGGYGHPDAAPYDRIILTVGAWDIAPAWWEQLKPDGRLLLPLDIAVRRIVEEKIHAFDLDQLESIVRKLAHREFRSIEILGAVIGFVVGLVQWGILVLTQLA